MEEEKKLSREEVDVLINYWIKKGLPEEVLRVACLGPSRKGFLKALLYFQDLDHHRYEFDLVEKLVPEKYTEYCKMLNGAQSPFVIEIVDKRHWLLHKMRWDKQKEIDKAVQRLENRIRRKYFFPIFSDIFQ